MGKCFEDEVLQQPKESSGQCGWLVTKNSTMNIWHSNWTNGGPLRKLIQGPIS